MSQKTLDIITENDLLKNSLNSLKTENGLLSDSERELAKKNQANQRVIRMLVEKLKGLWARGGGCGVFFFLGGKLKTVWFFFF